VAESFFEELKRYIRFDDEDVRRLRAFHPHAAPHFQRISGEFYERIREHQEAHAVFSGEEQIVRLRSSLVRWLERFCSAKRDHAYYEETAKIGQAHVRVGLPQRYMFTAMTLIRIALHDVANHHRELDPKTHETLLRAIDLDLSVMLEAYHDSVVNRLQRVDRMERETLGRALARTEHHYVNAVELAPYLVLGLDGKGTIVLFNREAEKVTGLARDEVLGTTFAETMLLDGTREIHADAIATAIAAKSTKAAVFESALITRTGSVRKVRWQLAAAPGGGADEVSAFAIGRDVTDESLLAERTKNAERLAAVGTLAAGLAHEIRNPLNGAQLHVTFLERGLRRAGADTETIDAVTVVGDEIKRLSALVNEFLDFARPRPLQKKRVILQALCERVAQVSSADATNAGCSIMTELPKTPLEVEIDTDKMEQVLLNLISNAVEAMSPTGGGKVTVRARRLPVQAVIEIEDEGPGLPAMDAPIFDAFYSTKPNGTGLGLSIVHRIVTDHGGTVSVESRPGHTVFRVTLPL